MNSGQRSVHAARMSSRTASIRTSMSNTKISVLFIRKPVPTPPHFRIAASSLGCAGQPLNGILLLAERDDVVAVRLQLQANVGVGVEPLRLQRRPAFNRLHHGNHPLSFSFRLPYLVAMKPLPPLCLPCSASAIVGSIAPVHCPHDHVVFDRTELRIARFSPATASTTAPIIDAGAADAPLRVTAAGWIRSGRRVAGQGAASPRRLLRRPPRHRRSCRRR